MNQNIEAVASLPQNYLQTPYNQFVWLRREFMALCDDLLEAMIMRVVEYEIEGDRRVWLRKATELIEQGKDAPQEPEWWITLSHRQIATRLYDAVKSEKTIIAKLKSLTQIKKFLLVRQNPDTPYGSPQYTINKQLVQGKLDALPALPSMRDAAKSQVIPPPNLTPPPNNDTPPKNWGEGDPKMIGGGTPKMGGGRPQNDRGGDPKNGGTNKNKKNDNTITETRERKRPSSPPEKNIQQDLSLSANASSPHAHLSKEKKSDEPKKNIRVVHPEHDFIYLDDATAPTRLTVLLTAEHCENEDDWREAIANEIMTNLAARGYKIKYSTEQEQDAVVVVPAPKKPATPKTERPPRPAREPAPKRDLLAEASPEVQAVVAQWRAIFKKPVAITKTLIEHATTLAAFQPEPGEIAQCREWMYSTDTKKWYSSHGMHLGDLAVNNFEKFRSLGDMPAKGTKSPPEQDRSAEARAQADEENRINFEKWEARNARLDAEKALKKGAK